MYLLDICNWVEIICVSLSDKQQENFMNVKAFMKAFLYVKAYWYYLKTVTDRTLELVLDRLM